MAAASNASEGVLLTLDSVFANWAHGDRMHRFGVLAIHSPRMRAKSDAQNAPEIIEHATWLKEHRLLIVLVDEVIAREARRRRKKG